MTFLSPPPPPAGLHSPASSAPWRMPTSPHASSRILCPLVLCVDVASDTHEGYPLCRPMVIGLDCWGKEEIVSGILKLYFNISSCEVIYPVFFLFVFFFFHFLRAFLVWDLIFFLILGILCLQIFHHPHAFFLSSLCIMWMLMSFMSLLHISWFFFYVLLFRPDVLWQNTLNLMIF